MSGRVFHGGGVFAASQIYGGKIEGWLDLSTGINPCPPPLPRIDEKLWHDLPDQSIMDQTRVQAAQYYGSGTALPIPSAGMQPLIHALAQQLGGGKSVAILGPTYGEYAAVFAAHGLHVDMVQTLDEVRDDHAALVIVNPNNPDGRTFERASLVSLAHDMSLRGALLIVDEAFGDVCPQLSVAGDVQKMDNLVVLRSFGKFFGYAGLRLSFAIASGPVAGALEVAMGPWPVSGPALKIAQNFMSGDIAGLRRVIAQRRDALDRILKGAGLNVCGGTDLFALVSDPRAGDIFDALARKSILVRKFDYRADWLRIGLFAGEADGARLTDALKEV